MKRLEYHWYARSAWLLLLTPLSLLFRIAVGVRRSAYRRGLLRSQQAAVPVIVVGNITVGGTGKTPLVAWLARYLGDKGYRPGIIARGYGGQAKQWPQQVRPDSDPATVGDEAVMLAERTHCPMAVGPDRVAAAAALVAHSDCDIIISDDGLQHYALRRDIEIAVIDGIRRFGCGDPWSGQRLVEDQRNLGLDPGLDELIEIDHRSIVEYHRGEDGPVVGLVDIEPFLDRLRGDAQLVADDIAAVGHE